MRTLQLSVMGTVLLVLGFGFAMKTVAEDVTEFSGSYDWSQGGGDRLSAEFKPNGENQWKVTFRFRFSGRNNTWKGTANGSLTEGGTLTGTATSGSRDWVFEAGIENGVMRGSHREIKRGGREYATGTFKLSR